MLTGKDIYFKDYETADDLCCISFQFETDYNPFGVKIADGEWANLYLSINPFSNEVWAEYDLSEEDYANVYEIALTDEEKEVFREAAERYIQANKGMTLTEYCEMLIREEI